MALKYIIEEEKSLDSAEADAAMRFGDFVNPAGATSEGRPLIAPHDPSSDDFPVGIVVRYETGPSITEDIYTYSDYDDLFAYEAGDYPVYFQPLAASSVVKPKTPAENPGGGAAVNAPSIDPNDVVGIVDLGGGPAVVEDGYADGNGTTYGIGDAGDFTPLGRAVVDQPKRDLVSNTFESNVPVRLDLDVIRDA
jgi:hypothetical protein